LLKVGFHRASLAAFTGFKSSPFTEGALFYGEKLVDVKAQGMIETQVALVEEPTAVECAPGGV
jgi:hypothetical protein